MEGGVSVYFSIFILIPLALSLPFGLGTLFPCEL